MQEAFRAPAHDGYFVWQPPPRDIAIWLNLDLVSHLERLLQNQPEFEVGGILLGRCHTTPDGRVVQIDGYAPVDSEHVRGPAYSLSQLDKKNLDRTLAHAQRSSGYVPVGFFRSHLRKGIYLDKADFSLFQAHFAGPCDVFLVARREPEDVPVAGFFFWEDGRVRRQTPYAQFPLNRDRLEHDGFTIEQTPAAVVSEVQAAPAIRSTAARTPAPIPVVARVKRAVYGTIGSLLIIGAVVCAALMRYATGPAPVTPPSLSVERSGGALRVSWDPRSAAVQHASNGVLWINDGGKWQRVDLPADRLKGGSFVYAAHSPDVDFRLDLLRVSKEGSESVRYVAENRTPPPHPAAITAPPLAQNPTVVQRPTAWQDTPPHTPPQPKAAAATRTRPVEQDDEDSEPPPPRIIGNMTASAQPPQSAAAPPANRPASQMPVLSPPQPLAPQSAPTPSNDTASARMRPRAEPVVTISTRPEPPPKYQEWIAKVPLVRAFERNHYKAGQDYLPPHAIRQVMPRIPPRLARELTGDSRVDFRVNIDRDGYVNGIELMTPESDGRLVGISASALKQWRFQPATLRNRRVASDLLVSIRFRSAPPDGMMAER